ncbi:hypothetical protein BpHYR1_005686, partial [Brachionus plicatilis]
IEKVKRKISFFGKINNSQKKGLISIFEKKNQCFLLLEFIIFSAYSLECKILKNFEKHTFSI